MGTEIQQHRYDAIMRRVGDLKGPGAKVAEILAELFPVVDLEQVPGELLILGGTHLGYGGTAIVAAGGQFPAVQLFNPINSGKIGTITRVIVSSDVNQTIRWSFQITELAGSVGSERIRDTRVPFQSRTSLRVRSEAKGAPTGASGQISVLARSPFVLEDPNGVAVLSPDIGFEIGGSSAASALFVTFYWRERIAESSELNLNG